VERLTEMADETTGAIELQPAEAARLVESGDAQLVDVRAASEHAAGHIAGARHLPLERLDAEADELDRDRPVVFYCRGGERSGMAAEAFRNSGWDAHNVSGGLVAWVEGGLPLEPADGRVAERDALPPA
jgi:rhodanese-related sulfurtransferase